VTRKLAVLVPVFNGGDRLKETVESCANAGLSGRDYAIFVLDNGSSDGAPQRLPGSDRAGAPIEVVRNAENLGRIGNWNRAVEIATEQGFPHACFLFVGDLWLRGTILPRILNEMHRLGAVLAHTPLMLMREDGKHLRISRSLTLGTAQAVVSSRSLIEESVSRGSFPLVPLQSSVFQTGEGPRLSFDSSNPSNTDNAGVLRYLTARGGSVLVVGQPFFAWRQSPTRFHSQMDPVEEFERTLDMAFELSAEFSICLRHGDLVAAAFARYVRVWARDLRVLTKMIRVARQRGMRPGGLRLLTLLTRRVIQGRALADVRDLP